MTLYRDVLRQAWDVSWRHKYLWFFGLFAALLGNGGELDFLFRIFNQEKGGFISMYKAYAATGIFSLQALGNFGQLFIEQPGKLAVLIFVILLVLAISIFLVWLAITSQVALVSGSALVSSSKKPARFSIGGLIDDSKTKFWKVLLLNILARAFMLLIVFLFSDAFLRVVFNNNALAFGVSYFVLIVIAILAALVVSYVVKYSIAYIAIKDEKLFPALRKGFSLFADNWLVSIEMAILIFLIYFLATVGAIIVLLALGTPLIFLAYLLGKYVSIIFFTLFMGIGGLLLVVFLAFAGALIATYQTSAWTVLFIRLTGRGAESKLVRIVDSFRKK
jgi:hypothetical protein